MASQPFQHHATIQARGELWPVRFRGSSTTNSAPDCPVSKLIPAYMRHAEAHYVKNGRFTSQVTSSAMAMRQSRRSMATRRPARSARSRCRPAAKFVEQLQSEAEDRRFPATASTNGDAVRLMFRWAVSQELVPGSVDHALRSVEGLKKGRSGARETKKVRPVSPAIVERSSRTCPHRSP